MNPLDLDVTLQEGGVLGAAVEHVCSCSCFCALPEKEICSLVDELGRELGTREVLEQLRDLSERSSGELSLDVRTRLTNLLTEFKDVLTFCNFTVLEHGINTGDAAPIKERMQMTPQFLCR